DLPCASISTVSVYSCRKSTPSSTLITFLLERSRGAHSALHSFPTRRSSDLGADQRRLARRDPGRRHLRRRQRTRRALRRRRRCRSEEHTSELQSRFDLVCRPLLEEKNNHCTTVTQSCVRISRRSDRPARPYS